MMKILNTYAFLLFSLLLLISCSGREPVSTDLTGSFSVKNVETPVSDSELSQSTSLPRGVLGLWQVAVDTASLTAEIIPARNAKAIGDIFDADLSQFLNVSPCSDCLQITGIYLEEKNIYKFINIDVKIRHPFNDISKRPDLHGFDVRGIYFFDTMTIPFSDIDVPQPDGSVDSAKISLQFSLMSGFDGCTSHYTNLLNDDRYFLKQPSSVPTINPFHRYFEDYSEDPFDPHNPSGHNVMPVGSDGYTRTLSMPLMGTKFEFYMVADVAYGQSAVLANRQDPQYFLPAFNRSEPWRIEYWLENNNLNYTDNASTADVVVQVFDWQHGATVDPDYPDPSNLSGIPESSDVKELILSVPDLQAQPIVVTTPESGTGTPQDPLQYRLKVTNQNAVDSRTITALLAVRDDLYEVAAPGGRLPVPESASGFPYSTEDIVDYSLYYPLLINMPITSYEDIFNNELLLSNYTDPEPLYDDGGGISIFALHFLDPLTMKFQYRWDFDYDGVNFDIDGGGMPSPLITFTKPGVNFVGLRMRTNSKPPREYIYSIPVHVKGTTFDETIPAPGISENTSYSRNSSMDIYEDRVYIAYESNRSGTRQIYVTYFKTDGTFVTELVSPNLPGREYYKPSISLKKEGTHRYAFITYTTYNTTTHDENIRMTRSDLNLTSMVTDLPVATNASYDEDNSTIIYVDGKLWVYYARQSFLSNVIRAVQSDDNGQNWINNSSVDSSSTTQFNPTAIYMGFNSNATNFICAFQDRRNMNERGYDVYLAKSAQGDGVNFPDIWNISQSTGKVHEIEPALSSYQYNIALAYVSMADGASESDIHLTIMEYRLDHITDYIIPGIEGRLNTAPAVSMYAYNHYMVACGSYDSGTSDYSLLFTGVDRVDINRFDAWTMDDIFIGNLDQSQAAVFPSVKYRYWGDSDLLEQCYAFKHFNQGMEEDTSPYTMQFGKIDVKTYLHKKK